MDTFPSMGAGSKKDVTQAYETLSHEFQHMVNFNQNVLIEGSSNEMDVWLDEGLAMASEQAYTGKGLQDRVDYYNVSNAIRNGQSLLYWDQDGDLLSNYSLSYLFMQYVKIQTGQGNKIFKEILRDSNNNYKAVENVAKKYINPNMTFGKLMTSFRIALLLKEPTGLYGFKGDPFFYQLKERIFTGSSANLRGGGAVVTTFQTINGFAIPVNKGANVTYIFMDRDITPPSSPVVNRVGDSDLKITGTSEPFSVVYAKVGQTEIGRTASSSTGVFSIPISSNRAAGTAVQVFAKDASGNVSTASIVTVQDLTAPKRPIVNAVIENKPVVTGQAEPGSKVEVRLGESLLGEGTAGADGSFSIAIPPQKAGVTLTVTASDVYGYVSEKATIMVKPILAGWVKSGSSWYYYDPVSGKIATGWLKLGSAWYYLNGNGVMQTGWELVTGKWYYFADSGAMKVGWLKSGTSWYYLGADGAMQTGWLSLGGKWYYLYSDGRMAASTTINGYHLGSNGVWIR